MSEKSKRNPVATVLSAPLGCLLAPLNFFRRQFTLAVVALALSFGACAACGIFLPATFQSIINSVRSAGVTVYTQILRVTGNEALRIVTYDSQVTAVSTVRRDMGILSFVYGEGAEARATVNVALGVDLKTQQYGVLSCEVLADTLSITSGSAPLAGTAFDPQEIRQTAFRALKNTAAELAIRDYWTKAREGLQKQFAGWALGLTAPEVPQLTICPGETASPPIK